MGKDRISQRTKGNLQPSSSSQAAENINAGQYSTLSAALNPFQAAAAHMAGLNVSGSEEAWTEDVTYVHSIDPNALANFRKLGKKEAVTRQKAIESIVQYLESLVSHAGDEKDSVKIELQAVLELWVTLYPKCSSDGHRQIRENSNKILLLVADSKYKKALAPVWKSLCGPWISSFFDPIPQVSKLALQAFNACFAEEKRKAAISYALEPLLNHVFVCNFESKLSDIVASANHNEDTELKFARIVGGSVFSLSYILETLDRDERSKQLDLLYNIVVNEQFWRPSAEKWSQPYFRKSIYTLVSKICRFAVDVLDGRGNFLRNNLGAWLFPLCLNEEESSMQSINWEAIILLTKQNPSIWGHREEKKPPLLNQLNSFISNKMSPFASIVYPCLLPLFDSLSVTNILVQGSNVKNLKNLLVSIWAGASSFDLDQQGIALLCVTFRECLMLHLGLKECPEATDMIKSDLIYLPIIKYFSFQHENEPGRLHLNTLLKSYLSPLLNSFPTYKSLFIEFLIRQFSTDSADRIFRYQYNFCYVSLIKAIGVEKDEILKVFQEIFIPKLDEIESGLYVLSDDFIGSLLTWLIDFHDDLVSILPRLALVIHKIDETLLDFRFIGSVSFKAYTKFLFVSKGVEGYLEYMTRLQKHTSPKEVAKAFTACFIDKVPADSAEKIIESVVTLCIRPMMEMAIDNLDFLDPLIKSFIKGHDHYMTEISEMLSSYIFNFSLTYEFNREDLLNLLSKWKKLFGSSMIREIRQHRICVFAASIFTDSGSENEILLDLKELTEIEWEILGKYMNKQILATLKHFHMEAESFWKMFDSKVTSVPGVNIAYLLRALIEPFIDITGMDWEMFCGGILSVHEAECRFKAQPFQMLDCKNKQLAARDKILGLDFIIAVIKRSCGLLDVRNIAEVKVNNLSVLEYLLHLYSTLKVYERHMNRSSRYFVHGLCQSIKSLVEKMIKSSNTLTILAPSDFISKCVESYIFDPKNLNYKFVLDILIESSAWGHSNTEDALDLISREANLVKRIILYRVFGKRHLVEFERIRRFFLESFSYSVKEGIEKNDPEILLWLNEVVASEEVALDVILDDRKDFLLGLLTSWSGKTKWIMANPKSSNDIAVWVELSCLISKFSGNVLDISEKTDSIVEVFGLLLDHDDPFISNRLVHLLYASQVFKCISLVMGSHEIEKYQEKIFARIHNLFDVSDNDDDVDGDVIGDWDNLLLSDYLSDIFDAIYPALMSLERPFGDNHLVQLVRWSLQYDDVKFSINLSRLIYARNLRLGNLNKDMEQSSFHLVLETMESEINKTINGSGNFDIEMPKISYLIFWYRWLNALIQTKALKNGLMAYLKLEGWRHFNRLMVFLASDCFNLEVDNNSVYWFQGLLHRDISDYYLDRLIDCSGEDSTDDESISILACHIYWILLNEAPALIRRWTMEYSSSKSRQLIINLETWSEQFFSPSLVNRQIMDIMLESTSNGNSNGDGDDGQQKTLHPLTLNVHKYQSMRGASVQAIYPIEESINMEVTLVIPANFPLKPVTVQGGRRMGVSESLWRKWLFQTEVLMSQQNGTLLDALILWKSKAERKFEALEECPICYSLIHHSDKSLPQTTCKTCQHKFHAACLFKWFKSSNQSTCPLCRSYF